MITTPITNLAEQLSDMADGFNDCPAVLHSNDIAELKELLYAAATAIEAKQQGPGEVLARGWFHALPEDDYEFHDDASGAGKNCPGCIRAMIVRDTPQVEAKRQTGEGADHA